MKGIELLTKYPKAAEVVRKWYLDKMVESFANPTVNVEIPQDFIDAFRAEGVKNEDAAILIDANPSTLFHLFDEHKVFIQINVGVVFSYEINKDQVIAGAWNTRKEAESKALAQAFEILNKQLEQ